MAFTYQPRVTGSNFQPVAIRIKREGQLLVDDPSIVVQVNIKDRDSHDAIVTDGDAEASTTEVGRWNYRFTPEQVALIDSARTWLIEWTVTVGAYTYRTPSPATMSVRKRL